jgi:hypothetical protein
MTEYQDKMRNIQHTTDDRHIPEICFIRPFVDGTDLDSGDRFAMDGSAFHVPREMLAMLRCATAAPLVVRLKIGTLCTMGSSLQLETWDYTCGVGQLICQLLTTA